MNNEMQILKDELAKVSIDWYKTQQALLNTDSPEMKEQLLLQEQSLEKYRDRLITTFNDQRHFELSKKRFAASHR